MVSRDERIVDPATARRLREEGYRAADLHVHPCSRDTIPHRRLHPRNLLRRAAAVGLDYIAFSDHNDIPTYGIHDSALVKAVEFDVLDVDFVGHTVHELVYGLDRVNYEELSVKASEGDLRSFAAYCNVNGLWLCYAHPLWVKEGEKLNVEAVPRVASLNHFIEVNGTSTYPQNRGAHRLARALGMPELANSDTHTAHLGATYTLAKGDGFGEWIQNVRRGDYYLVVEHISRKTFREELLRWYDLVFRFVPQNGSYREDLDRRSCTQIPPVDALIRSLIGGKLSKRPLLKKLLRRAIKLFFATGIADYYVQNEAGYGLRGDAAMGDDESLRRAAREAILRSAPAAVRPARTVRTGTRRLQEAKR
jgi:predicted metal-dependent phosphoesterase TrpH